jgi:hypothetical protein
MKFIFKKNTIILFVLIMIIIFLMKKEYFLNLAKKYKLKETFKCTMDINNTIDKLCYGSEIGKRREIPGPKYIKSNIPNVPTIFFNAQKDHKYHTDNLESSEAEELYLYLQSMVTSGYNSYELNPSSNKKIKSSSESNQVLLNFIKDKLQEKIKEIKIIDDIFYFRNSSCLEIQPFQISGKYFFKNKIIGNVRIQMELTFRFDQPNDIFVGQQIFNRYSGVFKFNRIVLVNHTLKKDKKQNLPTQINKPLTYNYENNDCGLDTVNSLIADDIKITNIEPTSEENTSEKINII